MLVEEHVIDASCGMMQVTVVKVIDVTFVFDRGVATLWTVLVPLFGEE
jgi:hypothetical protein